MPLEFFTDKDGKRKSRYVPPKRELSRTERLRKRQASFGAGGKFENNFLRNLFGGAGNRIDKAQDARQLERLKEFPEVQSDRFRNLQARRMRDERDAPQQVFTDSEGKRRTEGFNFEDLFMGTNVSADRRDPNEVRDDPEGGFIDASGKVTTEDILRSRPGVSEQDILNAIGNTQFNPAVVGSLMTPAAGFSTSALGDYLTGGQGVGGLMSDNNAMFSTFPDNTATNTVNMTAPRGNFNNVPPMERSISGGLLQAPTFNFDVAPFGGTGIYDNIMLEAIQNSPFGSGITLNPNLTPSTASAGFLGVNALNPTGTINIGNLGTVTDQFGRELVGQERIDFINNEFAKLQNQNSQLSNFDLNILR